jgi:hypothetical protein
VKSLIRVYSVVVVVLFWEEVIIWGVILTSTMVTLIDFILIMANISLTGEGLNGGGAIGGKKRSRPNSMDSESAERAPL